jgi:hypothetical protein
LSTWPGWARVSLQTTGETKRAVVCPEHAARLALVVGWMLRESGPPEESVAAEQATQRESAANAILDEILGRR